MKDKWSHPLARSLLFIVTKTLMIQVNKSSQWDKLYFNFEREFETRSLRATVSGSFGGAGYDDWWWWCPKHIIQVYIPAAPPTPPVNNKWWRGALEKFCNSCARSMDMQIGGWNWNAFHCSCHPLRTPPPRSRLSANGILHSSFGFCTCNNQFFSILNRHSPVYPLFTYCFTLDWTRHFSLPGVIYLWYW